MAQVAEGSTGCKAVDRQEWFELEWSYCGADDWYGTNVTADSLEALLKDKDNWDARLCNKQFETRVVRKCITTELVELPAIMEVD